LGHKAGRTNDQHPARATASVQLAEEEPGFDGFPEANIIGDEQPGAGHPEGPQHRNVLVGLKRHTGPAGGHKGVLRGSQTEQKRFMEQAEPAGTTGPFQAEFGNGLRDDGF
jgi:hypothetical protein